MANYSTRLLRQPPLSVGLTTGRLSTSPLVLVSARKLHSDSTHRHHSMSSITINNVKLHDGLLIGGKWVAGRGDKFETVDPATEEVITEVRLTTTFHFPLQSPTYMTPSCQAHFACQS